MEKYSSMVCTSCCRGTVVTVDIGEVASCNKCKVLFNIIKKDKISVFISKRAPKIKKRKACTSLEEPKLNILTGVSYRKLKLPKKLSNKQRGRLRKE